MKDPTDKYTIELLDGDTIVRENTTITIDPEDIKEWVWCDLQKKFVPYGLDKSSKTSETAYPFSIEDRKEEDK
jgi:hypothetical protein